MPQHSLVCILFISQLIQEKFIPLSKWSKQVGPGYQYEKFKNHFQSIY